MLTEYGRGLCSGADVNRLKKKKLTESATGKMLRTKYNRLAQKKFKK